MMSATNKDSNNQRDTLSFSFRGKQVPVTWSAAVSEEQAKMTVESKMFQTWARRCETSLSSTSLSSSLSTTTTTTTTTTANDEEPARTIDIHSVEIQSVDVFGARGVGFAKIKSHCTLELMGGRQQQEQQQPGDESTTTTKHKKTETIQLPGICLLRGDAVAILVALFCQEDNSVHSLLVEQPRIPVGQVACLELPAGMMDDDSQCIKGTAVKEMEEECGIVIDDPKELVDLTKLAFKDHHHDDPLLSFGIPLSQGGCDETMRIMYLEKSVTKEQLDQMRNKTTGLRHEGEAITLRVVPFDQVWRISRDAKAVIARFLLDQLRQVGKIPAPGELANSRRLVTADAVDEPVLTLNNGYAIPQLAFGCYKVPDNTDGETILRNAIQAGYRHFDTASYYYNEATLGRVLRESGIPREKFFLASKVWNDAQKEGRAAVRESVLKSLNELNFGGYWDLFLVHWPVPGHYVDTYHELELLQQEGKLRSIGLSNFSIEEYETLVRNGVTVAPAVNQFEVSPFMYRPDDIEYFQTKGNMLVSASKAMHRGGASQNEVIQKVAQAHGVTPGQVMIRWSLQKGLVVLTMSSKLVHQQENRSVTHFTLSKEEILLLDSLTDEKAVRDRRALEEERKKSL